MCSEKKSLANESLAFTARVIKCEEAVQAPLLRIKGVAYVVGQLGNSKGLPSRQETSLRSNLYNSLGKSLWWAKEDAVDPPLSWSSDTQCNKSGGDVTTPPASTEAYTLCQICFMNFSLLVALSTITNTLCSVNFHPFLAFSGTVKHHPFPLVYWVEISAFPKYPAAYAIPRWPREGTLQPNASPDGI